MAAEAANGIVGKPAFVQAGEAAQERAMVLLENKGHLLPLKPGMKVYLFGVDAGEAAARSLAQQRRHPQQQDNRRNRTSHTLHWPILRQPDKTCQNPHTL